MEKSRSNKATKEGKTITFEEKGHYKYSVILEMESIKQVEMKR